MSDVGVVVTSHDRDLHLLRQQDALSREQGWSEAVVCFMDRPTEPWPSQPAGVTTIHRSGGLTLSEARNAAARATDAQVLVFLDVDCLPAPGSIEQLVAEVVPGRLVMADPHYLPVGWTPDVDPLAVATPHPARRDLSPGNGSEWHMFWSLGFAIHRDDFERVGGFDEGFIGYGAEDTDFAFRCRDAEMELWWSRARVLHQAHPVYRPPLQHLDSIVTNARLFRDRWGTWPMEGWLSAFADLGLVRWDDRGLAILRHPTADELAAALVTDAPHG